MGLAFPLHTASADGIVSAVVSSPLSASGLVRDARVGINVWLQSESHPGPEFMDPKVVGYGIPPGGGGVASLTLGFELPSHDPNRQYGRGEVLGRKVDPAPLIQQVGPPPMFQQSIRRDQRRTFAPSSQILFAPAADSVATAALAGVAI